MKIRQVSIGALSILDRVKISKSGCLPAEYVLAHCDYEKSSLQSYYNAVVQIFTVTFAKDLGDFNANYDVNREIHALSVHVIVCIGIT